MPRTEHARVEFISHELSLKYNPCNSCSIIKLIRVIRVFRCFLKRFGLDDYPSDEISESVEINLKYRGYIGREKALVEKMQRLEDLTIPENFDFDRISGLTIECRQKFKRYAPRTIAQASRISGVSPADISVLLVYFGR